MKRNGSEKLPSFSLWSEINQNGCEIVFALMQKKCFFACFFIWNYTKIKWSENKTKKKQKLQSEQAWSTILGQFVK
jgi:hypothetical protein